MPWLYPWRPRAPSRPRSDSPSFTTDGIGGGWQRALDDGSCVNPLDELIPPGAGTRMIHPLVAAPSRRPMACSTDPRCLYWRMSQIKQADVTFRVTARAESARTLALVDKCVWRHRRPRCSLRDAHFSVCCFAQPQVSMVQAMGVGVLLWDTPVPCVAPMYATCPGGVRCGRDLRVRLCLPRASEHSQVSSQASCSRLCAGTGRWQWPWRSSPCLASLLGSFCRSPRMRWLTAALRGRDACRWLLR